MLNKILTDAISGGNESIRAIQKRYPSLSEKEAHEILAMVSATAQSNDDSAELVVTAPPSFALKTKPTKVTVREMLMGARKSILITGYSLSDYFAELLFGLNSLEKNMTAPAKCFWAQWEQVTD